MTSSNTSPRSIRARANACPDEFFETFDSIGRMPNQGFRRPELTSKPLRFKVVGNYLIAYAPEEYPVWILAILDGRRDPRSIAAVLRSRE